MFFLSTNQKCRIAEDEEHRSKPRIEYKIAVLVYKVLHGLAPRYLGLLTHITDLPGRRALHIPPVRLSTIGTGAFSVAGPSIWNTLYLRTSHLLKLYIHSITG